MRKLSDTSMSALKLDFGVFSHIAANRNEWWDGDEVRWLLC
jgi:hypothetical protein